MNEYYRGAENSIGNITNSADIPTTSSAVDEERTSSGSTSTSKGRKQLSLMDDINEPTNRKRVAQTCVDLVVIVILFIIFGCVWAFVQPKTRYLTCDQSDLFYPFIPDTVPFWSVGLYATVGPMLVILFVELLNSRLLPFQKNKNVELNRKRRRRKFLICLFHGLSLFILGIAITLLTTEIGKKWVGRLRPHFIDVCKPDFGAVKCTVDVPKGGFYYPSIYTGNLFCTNKDVGQVNEARVSFPSGHSSYSCYCMLFLIIYLEARLFLLRLRYIKPLIQTTAFIAAFITCMSRISDYHHRGTDVLGGMVLGCVVAYFVTYFVGRVLWEYETEPAYYDFDLKPTRQGSKPDKKATDQEDTHSQSSDFYKV